LVCLKTTTLVYIVGMFDLLGRVQAATHDSSWLGTTIEGYAFAGLFSGRLLWYVTLQYENRAQVRKLGTSEIS